MADNNDEKGKRPGARPAMPPFRGPASTPRSPLTPPAGAGQAGRSLPTPPAGGRTPFMPPPAGLRPRPATPAMPRTPAAPVRAVTPPGLPATPPAPAAATPPSAPVRPEPPEAPAWEPAVEAGESMPSVADFAPDAPAQSSAADPFAEWDEQLRDAGQERDASRAQERGFAAGEEAAGHAAQSDWSAPSFESLGDAGRALPKELSRSSPLQPELDVPEDVAAPFDTIDGGSAAEEPGEPAEKVGLYGDSRAPMSEDVVPAAATGQPAIDAMPPELVSAYPSLQDTAAYETFEAPRSTPESAIYAGEPAEAWEAATAGEADHGARERTARLLERIASRVRSGELHAPDVAAETGDAAALAALLASMLGGSRERGA